MSNGQYHDARFYRLLLPAQIMNQLTKLVENGIIDDVSHEALSELSDYTYVHALRYFTPDYLSKVVSDVATLKGRVSPESLDFDLQAWMATTEDVDTLGEKARRVFEGSYDNTKNYFTYGKAAGLYFMKSVVMADMQKWHQQRYGITDMIPSISLQDSDNGHASYNFRDNTTTGGDMHTNNRRFPFQRYVADYIETFAA
jgi:hypothetical protein